MIASRSTSSSPRRTETRQRERSAEFTSKDGFSVVAPTRTIVPFSTWGRNASCWARLNRWISSTKRIVRIPRRARSRSASPITSRISLTPDRTAEKATKRAPVTRAITDASVVLPEPGGPQRIIECSSPVSMAVRRTRPGPRRCSCPTISSIERGRTRSASGAPAREVDAAGSGSGKSSTLAAPTGAGREPGRQECQVREMDDRCHAPAIELGLTGAIRNERHAGLGRRHAVDPGIANDHGRRAAGEQRLEVARDHAPAVGIRLERPHVIAGDDELELVGQAEPLERRQGERASVVCPEGRREPSPARSSERLERAGLERGLLHRAPLVFEGKAPRRGFERRRLRAAIRDQLAHAVALAPVRQWARG